MNIVKVKSKRNECASRRAVGQEQMTVYPGEEEEWRSSERDELGSGSREVWIFIIDIR